MELQTREEVHLLCIFDDLQALVDLDQLVRQKLPDLKNRPEYFGEQFIVDSTGEFLAREDRLLISSADLGFDEAVKAVRQRSGLAIPAHVNRQAYGLIANLGMIPENVPIDALEISRNLKLEEAVNQYPGIISYPLLLGGDVHRLDEFMGANWFEMNEASIHEIRKALHHKDGRSYKIDETIHENK
jgi:PHP family Zn ribbon phosphoesterase